MSSAETAAAASPATTDRERVPKQNCKCDGSVSTCSEAKRLEPLSTYAVLKYTAGGLNPRASIRGVYTTEHQAYAAAIQNLIFDLEEIEGDSLPKLRAIATTDTLSLKDRLKSLVSCQASARDRFEFVVKRTHLFAGEDFDVDSLLEGRIWPCVYWDSSADEEDYDPNEDLSDDEDFDVDSDEDSDHDSDEEEDDDDDDDEAVGMDEGETCIAGESAKKKQRTE